MRTSLKFIGSTILIISILGILLAILGQLNFIGTPRSEAITVTKHQENKKNKSKYSFYTDLPKRTVRIDNKKEEHTNRAEKNLINNNYHYVVQAGAFTNKDDASRIERKLSELGYKTKIVKNSTKFLIQVGPFTNKYKAYKVEKQLKKKRYPTLVKKLK